MPARHVAIVGAGIVGLSCASYLRQEGYEVTLIDAKAPGMQTSYGNAGAFAISDIMPLSEPSTFRRIPGWMMDPLGPLALQWKYLPKLAPWLARFLWAGRPSSVNSLTEALSWLLTRATKDTEKLAAYGNVDVIWRRNGSLTLYESESSLAIDRAKWQKRREVGIACEEVSREQIQQLEPHVSERYPYAVHVPGWSYVDDPYLFSLGIIEQLKKDGVKFVQAEVKRFSVNTSGKVETIHFANGEGLAADEVVIASGIWSTPLLYGLGYRIPLESERGYHATLPNAGVDLKKFLLASADGFVILPMANGGIRVAGTVELASATAPESWKRAHILVEKAQRILPKFNKDGVTYWMGNRPSVPDTIPVIAKAPRHSNVYVATGHGHLGLTLAATTGQLITDLVTGRTDRYPQNTYRLDRF
ncbi:FAD-binding oxidoreductase [Leeia sp. TBRC 13508]|uniref:FAD-binding oxidoreductase n=1 Tax=Leeia speluncae TaxID=2884804 RepID=A0ABS8D8K7_9NEIS|nr:FAD-binding oxidoreductase [Leeia speluncae]MCB6184457.1 FAD-binding oxidoreductase [Leeia speluncae]